MRYYAFHIGDYQQDTAHLEPMEDLAYRRMLDLYYKTEVPLPLDVDKVARLIRMRTHCDCIAVVLREFFEHTDDGWFHQRVHGELQRAYQKSDAARRSAEARWAKEKRKKGNGKQQVSTKAMRTHSEGNADGMLPITHYPLPITHDSTAQNSDEFSAEATKSPRYSLPTNKNRTTGETYPVTDDEIGQWRQIYPGVDLDCELRKIIGWLDANPSKRKTAKGMKRFINNWLARAQDKGGAANGNAGGNHESHQRPDNSAAGRVRENIRREQEQWRRQGPDG